MLLSPTDAEAPSGRDPRPGHEGTSEIDRFGDDVIPVARHDEASLKSALLSLQATKTRTGTEASRADLNRVIKKFTLSAIDAAELEARAQDAGVFELTAEIENDGEAGDASLDAMTMFLDEARRFKLLRGEQHQQLARAIAIGQDAEKALQNSEVDARTRSHLESLASNGRSAFAQFVSSNLRLVVSIAKNYPNQGLDLADLVQEGCCGLIRAVELYEPQHGTQFSTYAYHWIMQSITRAIADQSRLIRLPVQAHDRLNKIRRAVRDLTYRFNREPTYAEVAEHIGASVEQVAALSQWLQHVLSLESPLGAEGDLELKEALADRGMSLDDEVVKRERDEMISRIIEECLTPRQADVVRMRFGLEDTKPMTLDEIGQRFGVTRERIRQIESKALARLRVRAEKYQALWEHDA